MPSETRTEPRSWLKSISSIAVLLLFVPLPAYALTFLGSWQFFQNPVGTPVQPNNADISFNDFGNLGGDLTVNMKNFSANNSGSLTVTAIRDFRIDNPTELVEYMHNFATILQNASLNVTVQITPYNISNPPPFVPPPINFNVPGGPTMVGASPTLTGTFNQGDFRLVITITYNKNAGVGQWDNVSSHKFSFRRL